MAAQLVRHSQIILPIISLQFSNDWKSDNMGSEKNNFIQYFHLAMQGESVFDVESDGRTEDDVIRYIIKRINYENILQEQIVG